MLIIVISHYKWNVWLLISHFAKKDIIHISTSLYLHSQSIFIRKLLAENYAFIRDVSFQILLSLNLIYVVLELLTKTYCKNVQFLIISKYFYKENYFEDSTGNLQTQNFIRKKEKYTLNPIFLGSRVSLAVKTTC